MYLLRLAGVGVPWSVDQASQRNPLAKRAHGHGSTTGD